MRRLTLQQIKLDSVWGPALRAAGRDRDARARVLRQARGEHSVLGAGPGRQVIHFGPRGQCRIMLQRDHQEPTK